MIRSINLKNWAETQNYGFNNLFSRVLRLALLTIFWVSVFSTNAKAADFTIQLVPAPNSVTNSQVADNSISSSKINNFALDVVSAVSPSLASYLLKNELLNCPNNQKINSNNGVLSCEAISIGDTEVSALSQSKITGLDSALSSKVDVSSLGSLAMKSSLVETDIPSLSVSKISSLQTILDAKADGSLLGSLAMKSSLAESDIPLLTLSKISDAGTLASKSKISNVDIDDSSIAPSKLSDFSSTITTLVSNSLSSLMNNYFLKSEMKMPTLTICKTSGCSGTVNTSTATGSYQVPTGVKYLKIKMVGAGGGGQGASSSGWGNAGGAGGYSLFTDVTETVYLLANGGNGGFIYPADGGMPLVSGVTNYISFSGGSSTGGSQKLAGWDLSAGSGASSYFGGAGGGHIGAFSGGSNSVHSARPNTGSGGGGGSGPVPSFVGLGAGGGAGAYIEATIPISSSPISFNYTVGAGGGGGNGIGSDVRGGGHGAGGIIIIEENYQ